MKRFFFRRAIVVCSVAAAGMFAVRARAQVTTTPAAAAAGQSQPLVTTADFDRLQAADRQRVRATRARVPGGEPADSDCLRRAKTGKGGVPRRHRFAGRARAPRTVEIATWHGDRGRSRRAGEPRRDRGREALRRAAEAE